MPYSPNRVRHNAEDPEDGDHGAEDDAILRHVVHCGGEEDVEVRFAVDHVAAVICNIWFERK